MMYDFTALLTGLATNAYVTAGELLLLILPVELLFIGLSGKMGLR